MHNTVPISTLLKSFRARLVAHVLIISQTALGAASLALSPSMGTASNNAPDIAAIDRAIASTLPGQERVRFGDVGMRVSDLKIFRDRLAGTASTQRRTGSPVPSSDTPNGSAFKWPGGMVNFRFDPTQAGNSTITTDKMRQFRDSVAEWAAFANLTFNEFSGTPPANYITVQEKADGSEGGFSSSVGMAGGEQFVQIGAHSWNRGTVCHEVGHAIGLFHEQQRDDRDTYVVINFNNINPADQPNFTKLPGGSTAKGAYDFYSVMHYARDALSSNGADTISMQPAYAQFINLIGKVYDRVLSKLDRAGMALVYGNPATLPGAVVTNTNDSGPGSLRTAVYFAFDKSTDAPPVPTTVTFHIPGVAGPNVNFSGGVFTIQTTHYMTAPGDGTTIDGTTQTTFTGDTNPNGPEIVLNGSVQALYETIGGTFGPCFILRQANCTVKGFVIQGYDQQGIQIANNPGLLSVATGNVVSGCYIGTDKTGTGALSNTFAGVAIRNGAQSNTIGGTTANARNVISGNKGEGIQVGDAGTNSNVILGNFIGTDAAGSAAVPNGLTDPANHSYAAGIAIFAGAKNNVIGGSVAGSANVISGNAAGAVALSDTATSGNLVRGNLIGTNPTGTSAIANGVIDPGYAFSAISIFDGPQSNTIGGTTPGAGNIVSGNNGPGILISGVGANANTIQGNVIGLTAPGNAALANQYYGVGIFGSASSNIVGGTVAGARNVLSGNGFNGVAIAGTDTNQNVVAGNFIGTDVTGSAAIGNGLAGVSIFGEAKFNVIGGTISAARNIISANVNDDVEISGLNTTDNKVQGNYIGLNAAGTAAMPNNNDGIGVFANAQSNTIGGTSPGTRNFISGHAGYGVAIADIGTNGNFIQGNTIGLNAFGSPVPNTGPGVAFFYSAQSNFLGGTVAGASNIISGNTHEGVAVYSSNSVTTKESISRNSIFSNGGLGIALYDGGNNSQPFPNLTTATLSSATNPNGTDVSGSLTAAPNAIYTVEFFASSAGNPSGFGEGQNFIGSATIFTDAGGMVNFTTSLAATPPAGSVIAATATDSLGNTSQFSADRSVAATADADGDGLPNNYEIAHGLNPNVSDANLDSDGDGLTNLQEFRAGTDPKSATSVFRISALDKIGTAIRVSFPSVNGKTYRLESRDDLVSGNWSVLTDQLFGTGSTLQITDPSAAGVSKRFYRVGLEP